MRPRMATNTVDIAQASYWLVDDASTPVGSGSSFFALETADFEWLGNGYVSSYERSDAVGQSATQSFALAPASSDEVVKIASAPVEADRIVSSTPALADAAIFAPETAPLSYASATANEAASAFVPFSTSFIDFTIYPAFEPVNSLLAVANEGPLAAINQGDMVYYLDEGIGASFVRYAVAETGGLLGGRDPFDPLTYIMGDTDGDGVTDYIIRMDETGPTLMGTDYII